MNERTCRKIVKARAGDHCERCYIHASMYGLTLHHRVKKGQGGPWTASNCVRLCGHGTTPDGCHSWVEHNPNDAEFEGFHVRPWNLDRIHEIPVLYRGQLAYLRDDGSIEYLEEVA